MAATTNEVALVKLSSEAPSPEYEANTEGDNQVQECTPPKTEQIWAASTWSRLGKAKNLRQVAEGELAKSAVGVTEGNQQRDVTSNRKQSSLRKKIDTTHTLSRALWDRTTGTEDAWRFVNHSVTMLHRSDQQIQTPLCVVEQCLELRRTRPAQENVNDIFQRALEEEQATLKKARQQYANRIDTSGIYMKELEDAKILLQEDLMRKRIPHLKVRTAPVAIADGQDQEGTDHLPRVLPQQKPEADASPSNQQRPQSAARPSSRMAITSPQRGSASNDVRAGRTSRRHAETLMAETVDLCTNAQRMAVKNEEICRAREKDCENARKSTVETMRKRMLQTVELKKALETEIRETDVALSSMEHGLTEIEGQCGVSSEEMDKLLKQVRQAAVGARSREDGGHPRDTGSERKPEAGSVSDDGTCNTPSAKDAIVLSGVPTTCLTCTKALLDQYRRKLKVVSDMIEVRRLLCEDLDCKTAAMRIDSQCSKLLTRPQSARTKQPKPPADGGASKPHFRRKHQVEDGATWGPGSKGW
jgi:hypothetical protein